MKERQERLSGPKPLETVVRWTLAMVVLVGIAAAAVNYLPQLIDWTGKKLVTEI